MSLNDDARNLNASAWDLLERMGGESPEEPNHDFDDEIRDLLVERHRIRLQMDKGDRAYPVY